MEKGFADSVPKKYTSNGSGESVKLSAKAKADGKKLVAFSSEHKLTVAQVLSERVLAKAGISHAVAPPSESFGK